MDADYPNLPAGVAGVVQRMDALLQPLEEAKDQKRHFLATYRRTTIAVGEEIQAGGFLDNEWLERWDVTFASLYVDALDRWNREGKAPGPWQVAFEAAGEDLPPLRHTLLGLNAHINYDLAPALLAVITDEQFQDPSLVARRAMDHGHIDGVLAARVPEEDIELAKVEEPGDRTLLDKLLTPFNQRATKRFLKEARRKVWHNASLLSVARRQGDEALAARMVQLEDLSRARVADLRRPGQVLLRLARRGFGVEVPA